MTGTCDVGLILGQEKMYFLEGTFSQGHNSGNPTTINRAFLRSSAIDRGMIPEVPMEWL